MKDLTARQQFLKDFFFKAANNIFKNKDPISFCWEFFWKYEATLIYTKFTQEEIMSIINNPENAQFKINNMSYTILNDDEIKFIQTIKRAYYKEFGIKKVKFEEYIPKIIDFFNDHKKIDFSNLDEKSRYEILRNEDIMSGEYRLYEALGITHMQYKHLYQKGSVFL